MKEETRALRERSCISYVKDGTLVLSEAELSRRGETLLYRLSVEPRPCLRKRDGAVFYSVTVERLSDGERAVACLRDFSSERSEAEAFYRRLFQDGVTPEGLGGVYEEE